MFRLNILVIKMIYFIRICFLLLYRRLVDSEIKVVFLKFSG